MYRTAYSLLLMTTLFWAGNAVAGKFAVGHVSPMLLTSMRWAMATIILATFSLPGLKRDWPVVRPRLLYLFLLGTAGFTAFNVAFYSAARFTTAINISIEQAGVPMLVFLGNFVLFRLRVSIAQIVGFLMSVAGVALTASQGDIGRLAGLDVNAGDALMLLAILLYSGYTIALRVKPQIRWQSLMLVLAASALVSSLPFTAWEAASGGMILPDTQGWAVAVYAGTFASVLSQVFYIRGNELIGGNRAGLFFNLVPIFGTGLSILLLGEAFHAYQALALVLVLGGIGLAEHSGRRMAASARGATEQRADPGQIG